MMCAVCRLLCCALLCASKMEEIKRVFFVLPDYDKSGKWKMEGKWMRACVGANLALPKNDRIDSIC